MLDISTGCIFYCQRVSLSRPWRDKVFGSKSKQCHGQQWFFDFPHFNGLRISAWVGSCDWVKLKPCSKSLLVFPDLCQTNFFLKRLACLPMDWNAVPIKVHIPFNLLLLREPQLRITDYSLAGMTLKAPLRRFNDDGSRAKVLPENALRWSIICRVYAKLGDIEPKTDELDAVWIEFCMRWCVKAHCIAENEPMLGVHEAVRERAECWIELTRVQPGTSELTLL
jgi:hypothetical protein